MRQFLICVMLTLASFFAKAQITTDQIHGRNDTDANQYAILYVYTTSNFQGHYILRVDNAAVLPIFINSKFEIKLYREGSTVLSVKDKDVNVNIEFGKEYYLNFEISGKRHSEISLALVLPNEGRLAYQKIMQDSIPLDNRSYIVFPKLEKPSSWCKEIRTSWNNLLAENSDVKHKFDAIPDSTPYYFYILFTIDTSGKLTINDPGKFTKETPKIDSICFKALYAVLQETQWYPAYVKGKNENSGSPANMEGHAYFTVSSSGFESVEMIKRINYPRFSTIPFDDQVFYSCNCGK